MWIFIQRVYVLAIDREILSSEILLKVLSILWVTSVDQDCFWRSHCTHVDFYLSKCGFLFAKMWISIQRVYLLAIDRAILSSEIVWRSLASPV